MIKKLSIILCTITVLVSCDGLMNEETKVMEFESKLESVRAMLDFVPGENRDMHELNCHRYANLSNLNMLFKKLSPQKSPELIAEHKAFVNDNYQEYRRLCNEGSKQTVSKSSQPSIPSYLQKAHSQYNKRSQGYQSSYLPRVGTTRGDDYRNCISKEFYLNADPHDFCSWHAGIGKYQ